MEEKQQPKAIKFADIKERLVEELNKKIPLMGFSEPQTLIDGFISQPLSLEISNAFVIGGPTIPMVMIVGNVTGRITFLAVKILLPDFDK
jgi:hypothetical protein